MLEVLVSKKNEEKKIALLENGNLVEYYEDNDISDRKEGNIYLGQIKDIVKGMQSAFVDIGLGKNSFIHLKDILPKVDETKNEVNTNLNIEDVVKPNQKILVQIKKDSNAQKGARVSTHISIPSKYIVLMPNTDIITLSQKIQDIKEKERLSKLVSENLDKGLGAIIRTSAVGKNEEIIKDIQKTKAKWNEINEKYNKALQDKKSTPGLIYEADTILYKMLIDLSSKKIERIIVDNSQEYDNIRKFLDENEELKNIKLEKNEDDILNIYDIEKQLEKMQKRKIWLKCGGFITIDPTEALTAIDVNTGKYTGTKDLEQTIFTVNKEASIEIAKQLRLRDIGGIIIIDYIDMNKEENKQKIQNMLEEKLKEDRSKTQVEGFTKLDLMEMTRKHICSHK